MPNLTKREIVLKVAEETPSLRQAEVVSIIQKTLDHITDALAKGQNIEIRNFGVFEVVLRRSKPGRNPRRPEVDVIIPARAAVRFSAGKVMRERVLHLTEKLKNKK